MSPSTTPALARLRYRRTLVLLAQSLLPLSIVAQSASGDAEPAQLKPVTISTGSNIPSMDEVPSVPVQVYTAETLERAGAQTINELVKKLPSFTGNGNYAESRVNGGDGSAGVSLRGIGAGGTVVLINGRRYANGDLNMLPVAAIERIEVLKDGASAIYGADAVGGVVNVILRKDYNGVEVGGGYGNTTEKDLGTRNFYVLLGQSGEHGHLTAGATYYDAGGLYSVDRARSRPTITAATTSGSSNPGRIRTTDPAALQLFPGLENGLVYTGAPGTVPASTGAFTDYNGLAGFNGESHRFPYPNYTPAILPNQRYSVFGDASRQVFGEHLELFAEGLHSHGSYDNGLAPTPGFGLSVPANNPFNVFHVPLDNINYRFVELGPRTETDIGDLNRFVLGLRGQFGDSTWHWEAAGLYTQDRRTQRFGNDVDPVALQAALDDTDPATAYNLLGRGGNTAAAMDRVRQTTTRQIERELRSLDAKVNGEVFELPAGPIKAAFGYEYREERSDDRPDLKLQLGQTVGFNQYLPFSAGRDIHGVWGEVLVPITSPSQGLVGLHRVELGAAGRFENYSDFGNNAVPKVTLRWQPFDDTLMFRASYSQSYTAPTLGSLYSGGDNYPVLDNRYLTVAGPSGPVDRDDRYDQIAVKQTANPDLKASDAHNYSVGAVWSPRQIQKLTVAVDLFRIEQSNVVGGNPQSIIDANFRSTGGDPTKIAQGTFGNLITANDPTDPGFIQEIDFALRNQARRVIEGLDVEVAYELKTETAGTFLLDGNVSYYLTFKQEDLPGAGFRDYLGDFSSDDNYGFGSLPRVKFRTGVDWEAPGVLKGFDLGAWANYIGQYNDDENRNGGRGRKISDIVTFDLQASYSFHRKTKLTVGVINVADTAPPFAAGAFADNYDRDTHDLRGRFVYGQVSHKF